MSDVMFTLFVDENPFLVGPFRAIADAGRPYTTRAVITRSTESEIKSATLPRIAVNSTSGKTPDTFRAAETGNSDPVKRKLATDYNFWRNGLTIEQGLAWSRITSGMTSAERIAKWQAGKHTQIAK